MQFVLSLTHWSRLQELKEAQSTIQSLKASLQERDDKHGKLVKTMKAARVRIDSLKSEKDQVSP